MPELPEVETVMRGLNDAVKGLCAGRVDVYIRALRKPLADTLARDLEGRTFVGFERRAKYIIMTLDDGSHLLAHLGMTGSFTYLPPAAAQGYQRVSHDHVIILFSNGARLVYNDPRRFGMIELLPRGDWRKDAVLRALGAEPLERNFTGAFLWEKIRVRSVPIKQAIMDQKIVVGVGNIYASEALYLAGISPLRRCCDMTVDDCGNVVRAIKQVLRAAIRAGGSTLRNYRTVGGARGNFQTGHAVYDRAGAACPDCTCDLAKTAGIVRVVQGGRSSFYCPRHQV